ncbi:hypothetical protein [Natronorubrum tibetense]|uniref:Uncharacterized protein n=1 Tax=Natronorubrum tibetense GA33 TaxID=1114856 RepID=L9VPM5_9EURY|nr:hypothetical protein [Natronorubrum tibetense]ELY39104.1 hypothetical protein C496_14642 [Natronorubrum tibetense GA33]
MPEDNRFAGLSDAVEDDELDDADEESASDTGSSVPDDDSSANADSSTTVEYESTEADAEEGDGEQFEDESSANDSADRDADDPTAFPFDATKKKTVYVRPETLDGLEDARALVDAQLRTEHDVRDLTGREFYDAAFRLAAADTDGLIDEILEAREE